MGPRRCVLPGGPRSSWGSWGASAPCVCQPQRWLHSLAHGIAIAQALLPASVLTSPVPLALLPPSYSDLQMTLGHPGEPEELPIPRSLTSSHLPSPFCMYGDIFAGSGNRMQTSLGFVILPPTLSFARGREERQGSPGPRPSPLQPHSTSERTTKSPCTRVPQGGQGTGTG